MNLNANKITITTNTRVANFKVLTSKQVLFIKPSHPTICSLIKNIEHDNRYPISAQDLRQQNFQERSGGFWYLTPEKCKDTSNVIRVEKKIF